VASQLLWVETLIKILAGLPLLAAPITTAKLLGLPSPGTALWPRLLGAVLIGLGLAAYIEGSNSRSNGLGFAGAVVINLIGAATLASLLVAGQAAQTARGRSVLWVATVVLALLSLLQLAHI
jgi:thiol:disulfide interchange protein